MQKYELIQTREIETLRQTVDRLRDELAETRSENARMRAALERVESWTRAYPTTIFSEPDMCKVRELLEDGGITLDSVSAHTIRSVIIGVREIVEAALGAEERK